VVCPQARHWGDRHLLAHVDPFEAKLPHTILIRQAMADPKFDTRMANKTVLSNVEDWRGITGSSI
jgi:hypothetical protein